MTNLDQHAGAAVSVALMARLIQRLVANGALSRDDAVALVELTAEDFGKDKRYFARSATDFLGELADKIRNENING